MPVQSITAFRALLIASRPITWEVTFPRWDDSCILILDRHREEIARIPMGAFAQDWAEAFVAAVNAE